jgi:hypothetical protein
VQQPYHITPDTGSEHTQVDEMKHTESAWLEAPAVDTLVAPSINRVDASTFGVFYGNVHGLDS